MLNLQELRNVKRIPFWYVVPALTLAANASGLATLNLNSDSHFLWTALFASSSEDADTDFMPNNFSVQITDQSTGRNLTSAAVPQRIIAAPSNGGGLFANMTIFPPNTVLTWDINNLTANQNIITIVMKGIKLFNFN